MDVHSGGKIDILPLINSVLRKFDRITCIGYGFYYFVPKPDVSETLLKRSILLTINDKKCIPKLFLKAFDPK
jgi:hypothetical protein